MRTDDGVSANSCVNTWNFAGVPTSLNVLADSLHAFYNTQPAGQVYPLAAYLSQVVQQSAGMTIKLYDNSLVLAGGNMGSPVYEETYSLANPQAAGTPLPTDVAAVLTLEGTGRAEAAVEVGATRPKQRRTGRVYLGPLNVGACQLEPATNDCRPHEVFRSVTFAALANLRDAAVANGVALGVWSRSNATVYSLEAASMDDAFDHVSSRKRGQTTRTRVTL